MPTEIDPKYFPILAAIITGILGIALGSLLSELRGWFEVRRGNRRILRLALYHQFELLGQLSLLNRSFTDILLKSFQRHIEKITNTNWLAAPQTENISQFLSLAFQAAREKDVSKIVEKHETTIQELASADPLLAADLRPGIKFPFQPQLDQIFDQIAVGAMKTDLEAKLVAHFQAWTIEKAYQRIVADLKKSISRIAIRIGPITWLRARRQLATLDRNRDEGVDEHIGEYVEELVRFVTVNLREVDEARRAAEGK